MLIISINKVRLTMTSKLLKERLYNSKVFYMYGQLSSIMSLSDSISTISLMITDHLKKLSSVLSAVSTDSIDIAENFIDKVPLAREFKIDKTPCYQYSNRKDYVVIMTVTVPASYDYPDVFDFRINLDDAITKSSKILCSYLSDSQANFNNSFYGSCYQQLPYSPARSFVDTHLQTPPNHHEVYLVVGGESLSFLLFNTIANLIANLLTASASKLGKDSYKFKHVNKTLRHYLDIDPATKQLTLLTPDKETIKFKITNGSSDLGLLMLKFDTTKRIIINIRSYKYSYKFADNLSILENVKQLIDIIETSNSNKNAKLKVNK